MKRHCLPALVTLAFGILFSACPRNGDFRLYAFSWGQSTDFKKSIFVSGADPDETTDFEWVFWVVRGEDRVVLVDTGCSDSSLIKSWAIRNFLDPVELLRQIGIQPEEVSDVVLTHGHWDHMGNLSLFGRAQVWIQEKEYRHMAQLFEEPKAGKIRKGYRREDYELLETLHRESRLNLVRGDWNLAPGLRLYWSGGHTPGTQMVRADKKGKPILLISDNGYFYENILWDRPSQNPYDPEENRKAIQLAKSLVANLNQIVPGHDPKVFGLRGDKNTARRVEL